MFRYKLVSSNAITTLKLPKLDNVPINVVAVVTTHSQQLEQQVLKEREPIKSKGTKVWQQEEHIQDSFIKTMK
jgi:hypothetical protein